MGVAAAQVGFDHQACQRLRVRRRQAGSNEGAGDKAFDPFRRNAGDWSAVLVSCGMSCGMGVMFREATRRTGLACVATIKSIANSGGKSRRQV